MKKNFLLVIGLAGFLSLTAMDDQSRKKARVICAARYYDDLHSNIKFSFGTKKIVSLSTKNSSNKEKNKKTVVTPIVNNI